jgi:excisionase family DNA binding protein
MNMEYTPIELAVRLSVSVKTINNYLNKGKLVGYKVGGRWRVPFQSVEKFLEQSNIKFIGGIVNE